MVYTVCKKKHQSSWSTGRCPPRQKCETPPMRVTIDRCCRSSFVFMILSHIYNISSVLYKSVSWNVLCFLSFSWSRIKCLMDLALYCLHAFLWFEGLPLLMPSSVHYGSAQNMAVCLHESNGLSTNGSVSTFQISLYIILLCWEWPVASIHTFLKN